MSFYEFTMNYSSIPALSVLAVCFTSEVHALNYLVDQNAMSLPAICKFCHSDRIALKKKPFLFRCKDCRKAFSMLANTFFSGTKLPVNDILLFAYLWLLKTPIQSIMMQIGGMSSETAANWNSFLYELVAWDMETMECKIGGEGIVVEIDESKFGKRKYHRGHRVQGVWVVGGVERTPERRMFAISVQDRSKETLNDIIEAYVLPGSIVHTDCWAGYDTDDLNDMGIDHATVNHTQHYKDPETGVHTNTIEGTWAGMKQNVHKRHRTKQFIEGRLLRFIWERKYKDCLWHRLLSAIGRIRYS
jgi:hypothetical protein